MKQLCIFSAIILALCGVQYTSAQQKTVGTAAGQRPQADTQAVDPEGTQTADNEEELYKVGDPAAKPRGRATLTGYIFDERTGNALPGAYIILEGTNNGSVTDADGRYSLTLPPGRLNLIVRGVTIPDSRRRVELFSDGALDISVYEMENALEEVTVLGDRADNIKDLTLGYQYLSMEDIKNIPTAFGESDIMRILLSLPGVKSVGEMSTGFNVRGGATDQNLILFNGGTIYNPSHMFGLFSAINPDVVEDMQLYKSSIPARYGGRLSSVLVINGREGNMQKFTGSAGIGLLTSRLTLEGPIVRDRASLLVAARTTYSDWLLGMLPTNTGYRDGRAGFSDFNATLTLHPDIKNKIWVNGYYSRDRFRFVAKENYKYYNGNASVKWNHFINPKLMSSVTAGYDHYGYNITNQEDSLTAYRLQFKIDQIYGRADLQWKPNNRHTFNAGVNVLHYKLSPGIYDPFDDRSLVEPDRIDTENALESAFYISDQWNITNKLAIDLGIRYSIFNVLGPRIYNIYDPRYLPSLSTVTETVEAGRGVLKTYSGPEFRGAIRYAFTDDLAVKAGVNSMRQYIHKISNSSIMSPTDIWKLSDMTIRPQQGVQYSLGLYKNLKGNMIETSIEAYYKTIERYLDYRPAARIVMNHNLETDVLETEGRAYGVEFMVQKKKGSLNGWVSYTYSRTHLRQVDKRITNPVNNGEWYPADFDKPHEFKLVGNYMFNRQYSFSLNCDFASGRPMTVPVAKYVYMNDQFVYYSQRNRYRIPNYFRVDIAFNVEPNYFLPRLSESEWSFGIYNLTGRRNAYSVYYKSDKGFINGYRLSIFGMPIPYVSFNIKF